MTILLISNRKGGVGKSTIACHAAWHFSERRRVLVIELDTQRNASSTLQKHKIDITTSQLLNGKAEIPTLQAPGISVIKADDELKSMEIKPNQHIASLKTNAERAAEDYEVVIFDAAPSADALNIGPMLFATHVLAPITLTRYSLQGIEALLQSIVGMQQQYNKDLVFLGMLPNQYVANSPNQREALKDLFERVGDKFMFNAVVSQRQAYEHTASTMEPAWKDTKTAARVAGKEMRKVMQQLEDRMFG